MMPILTRPEDLWSSRAADWTLDPGCTFLNHGSFGACPRVIQEEQQRLRELLERQPVHFMLREFEPMLDAARAALSSFLGAAPEELAFVTNATSGVNTVLRALSFSPGDELLVTDHEYNACRNALNFVADRHNAKIVVAPIPYPVQSPQQIVDAVMARVTDKTRLALLDHVTSQTALILPLPEIIAQLRARGVDTLIDGAHAPGMLPLDLTTLGATYYTGNCHKWLCSPRGVAFLYVQKDRQPQIRPLVISHGANAISDSRSRFQLEFDWLGTDDPTAICCIPRLLDFMGSLCPGGWSEVMAHNHDLALKGRKLLSAALGCPLPCPDEMIGSIATLPLPDGSPEATLYPLYDPLQQALLEQFNIEVPIFPFPAPPKRLLRISAQLYNNLPQYDFLAKALTSLLSSL